MGNQPIITSPTSIAAASPERRTSTTLSTTSMAHVAEPALKSAQISLSSLAPSSTNATVTFATTLDGVLQTPEPAPRPPGAAEVPDIVGVGARIALRGAVSGTMTLQVWGAATAFEQDIGVKPMLEKSIAAMAGADKDAVSVALGARRLNSPGLRGWVHGTSRGLTSSSQVFADFEIKDVGEELSEKAIRAAFASKDIKSVNAVLAAQSEAAGLIKYRATVMDITLAETRLAAIVATSSTMSTNHDQLKGVFVATSSTTTIKHDEHAESKGERRQAPALLVSLLGIASAFM